MVARLPTGAGCPSSGAGDAAPTARRAAARVRSCGRGTGPDTGPDTGLVCARDGAACAWEVAAVAAVKVAADPDQRLGAFGLAEAIDPLAVLSDLARRGVKAAGFEGAPVIARPPGG